MSAVEKVSIALSNELLRAVRGAVSSGEYATASEVVREALREWKQRRVPGREAISAPPVYPLSKQQHDSLRALAEKFAVRQLSLFGSALRADFRLDSDVDFAVEFADRSGMDSVQQYFGLKSALEKIFGRNVDLVELPAMIDSRLKREIERTQVPVYVEAA